MFKRPGRSTLTFGLAAFLASLLLLVVEQLLFFHRYYEPSDWSLITVLSNLPGSLGFLSVVTVVMSGSFSLGQRFTDGPLRSSASVLCATLSVWLPYLTIEHFGVLLLCMLSLSFSTPVLVHVLFVLPFTSSRTRNLPVSKRRCYILAATSTPGAIAAIFIAFAGLMPLEACMLINFDETMKVKSVIAKVEAFRHSEGRLPTESPEDVAAMALPTSIRPHVFLTDKGYNVMTLGFDGPFVKYSSYEEPWECGF